MATNKKEFDEGYKAAIEAIKKQLEKGSDPSDAANDADGDLTNPGNPNQDNSNGNGSRNGNSSNSNSNSGNSGSGNSGDKSRTSKDDSNKGVVRPEDCDSGDLGSGLDNAPDTPGSMIDRSTGDQIAQAEGYDKEGGDEKRDEQEWKDRALKAAKGMGDKPGYGSLKTAIESIYKPTKDWKKELRKVVGYSISPEDKRSAYANKNVLITQDRIARTDKDKYDSVDYIMAFIDSSGSMQENQLKMCLSEVYQVALQKKPLKIYVIQCDTQIQDIKEFTSVQALKKEVKQATVKGRGGTDFRACWNLLKTDKRFKGRSAELVMIFTDGWCPQYKRDPRTMQNLCWVILDNNGWNIENKDIRTKVVYMNTSDIK